MSHAISTRVAGLAAALLVAVWVGVASAGPDAEPRKAVKTCEGEKATVVGKQGDDSNLKGTRGKDVIVALSGDDFINGRGGDDIICAGSGGDFVVGGGGDDTANGDPGDDILLGSGGNDDLFGKDGDDGINGEDGKDLCHGGPGKDLAVRDDCEKVRSADRV
ncbi:MAG: hypothetical protein M3355_09710 [Actinomycetota bacterium]|nr:hypothetical protein [Actinomycetota bacterium]